MSLQVPLVVPILMLVACMYLLVAPIVQNPAGSGSFTLLLLLAGLIVYVPFVHMGVRLPGMGKCVGDLVVLYGSSPDGLPRR